MNSYHQNIGALSETACLDACAFDSVNYPNCKGLLYIPANSPNPAVCLIMNHLSLGPWSNGICYLGDPGANCDPALFHLNTQFCTDGLACEDVTSGLQLYVLKSQVGTEFNTHDPLVNPQHTPPSPPTPPALPPSPAPPPFVTSYSASTGVRCSGQHMYERRGFMSPETCEMLCNERASCAHFVFSDPHNAIMFTMCHLYTSEACASTISEPSAAMYTKP